MSTFQKRFWEIDLIRGCAVIMMVIFHIIFDLNFFSIYHLKVSIGFWRWEALLTATLFILLAGISLTISFERRKVTSLTSRYRHSFQRGIGIFLLGMLITIVTYLVLGEGFIFFGILHCIGLSIILGIPFLRHPMASLIGAFTCFLGGLFVDQIRGPLWLSWIGVHPTLFYSVDYVPLIPWFGIFLLGITVGSYMYPHGSRLVALSPPRHTLVPQFFTYLGRHSLALYLIHQPVIILILGILFPGSISWF